MLEYNKNCENEANNKKNEMKEQENDMIKKTSSRQRKMLDNDVCFTV